MEVKVSLSIRFHRKLNKWFVDVQDDVLLLHLEVIEDSCLVLLCKLDLGSIFLVL